MVAAGTGSRYRRVRTTPAAEPGTRSMSSTARSRRCCGSLSNFSPERLHVCLDHDAERFLACRSSAGRTREGWLEGRFCEPPSGTDLPAPRPRKIFKVQQAQRPRNEPRPFQADERLGRAMACELRVRVRMAAPQPVRPNLKLRIVGADLAHPVADHPVRPLGPSRINRFPFGSSMGCIDGRDFVWQLHTGSLHSSPPPITPSTAGNSRIAPYGHVSIGRPARYASAPWCRHCQYSE